MDLLQTYQSGSSSSELSEEDDQAPQLQINQVRSVYLITYSRADSAKFGSRNDFADAVVKSFTQGTAKVRHWCCCREQHKDGGLHYHMVIKLDRNHRWLPSKEYLMDKHGISVHYSSLHHNYYSAWRYVTNADSYYVQSSGHPRLTEECEPTTNAASRARHQRQRQRNHTEERVLGYDVEEEAANVNSARRSCRKKKRLTAFELSQIIIRNGIKSLTELQALAYEQKEEGKTDLVEFLFNRTPRAVSDILQTAWDIETAPQKLERAGKTRMDLLLEAKASECVYGCNGNWRECAIEILNNNGISLEYFRESAKLLLEKGRGKYRNMMIIGPADCGKTFLFNPLRTIYETFCNPATGSFAWVGVENSEVIFLNDFRWSPQLIPWHDLLLLLEGQEVHFPAPKTHFAKDISVKTDTPVFCTSKSPLRLIKNGVIDERETDMMSVRWNVMQLSYQIPRDSQREIPPCGRCFASLILT